MQKDIRIGKKQVIKGQIQAVFTFIKKKKQCNWFMFIIVVVVVVIFEIFHIPLSIEALVIIKCQYLRALERMFGSQSFCLKLVDFRDFA